MLIPLSKSPKERIITVTLATDASNSEDETNIAKTIRRAHLRMRNAIIVIACGIDEAMVYVAQQHHL